MYINEERFWSHVDRSAGASGCWLWTACINVRGYGLASVGTGLLSAHRVSWSLANPMAPLPPVVMHLCDNPRCVNPAHLKAGTLDANNKDCAAKGRTAKGERHGLNLHPHRRAYGARNANTTHPERKPKGEKHGKCRYPDSVVREIRARRGSGERCSEIARSMGVSYSYVIQIATNPRLRASAMEGR
jgi:HNH endonuclease